MREIPPIENDWLQVKMKIQAIQNQLHLKGTPSIPAVLQEMLVYGEDHRFSLHCGYDIRALLRAAYRTIRGHPQGGSTIAQQLARVVTGRFDRSIYRKLRELRLAVRITESFPREQIPALYLMVAYFGWRMNGLVQAYHRLNLTPIGLSDEQAAGLIARLKYPEPRISPERRTRQIAKRTAHILKLRSNLGMANSICTGSAVSGFQRAFRTHFVVIQCYMKLHEDGLHGVLMSTLRRSLSLAALVLVTALRHHQSWAKNSGVIPTWI